MAFDKRVGKWHGRVQFLKPLERSGLPPYLRDRTELNTDYHVDEDGAARAVDKRVARSGHHAWRSERDNVTDLLDTPSCRRHMQDPSQAGSAH